MIERWRRFSERDLLLDMPISPRLLPITLPFAGGILKSPRIGQMSFGIGEKRHETEIMPESRLARLCGVADLFPGPAWV